MVVGDRVVRSAKGSGGKSAVAVTAAGLKASDFSAPEQGLDGAGGGGGGRYGVGVTADDVGQPRRVDDGRVERVPGDSEEDHD